MNWYKLTLKPLSAFGTPLAGDTLFGQLCWTIRNRFGEDKLAVLLNGYDENKPFMVVSDAFPADHLPLPHLPSKFWAKGAETERKMLKKKQWISLEKLRQPTMLWQQDAKAESELIKKIEQNQPHNSINRMTSTTDDTGFAPYSMSQIWYDKKAELDIYIVLDQERFSVEELELVLSDIALLGFGRDASIGLGRFEIIQLQAHQWASPNRGNAFLTLANAAPQRLNLDKSRSFYQITTRFGRHGDMAVFSQNPFKKPVILTKSGAIFTPMQWQEVTFLGNGLAGVSHSMPEAVHQGYTPVLPLYIDFSIDGVNDG